MASTVKHLRSSTANKRPTASGLADGQLGINTASGTPGVFFKNSAGTVTKVGPAHVGGAAPNATPAGSAGNSLGELWVNNSTTINGLNYFTGSAFVNLTPSGTTTVAGLVELATDAETQTGTDTVRAVTPSGLQSKVSNSISTTSSTTIASATAVKTAYDLANAALPKSGGRVTGALEIGPVGSLVFEGSTDDGFETTIAVVNPTADRTVTFPNIDGTVVTTGDTGSVTSTMLLNGTILNADVNASAAIDGTKVAPNFGSQTITTTGVISPALGSAALPSVAFTGDPNTGIYSPGADQVAISTNGTGRLTIDSSGRLLVGMSSSTINSYLQLQGGPATSAGNFSLLSTLATPGTGTTLGTFNFGADPSSSNTQSARIAALREGGTWTAGVSQPTMLTFSTAADGEASPTEALRITNDKYLRMAASTGGIQFNGDTAAANALDDYEEGTWTPTVIGTTLAGTATYSTQDGVYTKVGRQVTVTGIIVYTGGTGTGNLRVSGLPFTSAATSNARGSLALSNIVTTASTQAYITQVAGATQLEISQFPLGGGTATSVAYDAAGTIGFSVTYFV